MIRFSDFFKLDNLKNIKVKFNMFAGRNGTRAWDILFQNEESSVDDEWIGMNAHRRKHANNNLDRADYLLSFAQYYPLGSQYYIFGGLYKVKKIEPEIYDDTGYNLELLDFYKEYRKRLIIKLRNPIGRDLYMRWFDKVQEQLDPEIYEITPSIALENFPGYNEVSITHYDLQRIFNNESEDWKLALSRVKGVYCITDISTGKLYIGSASGDNEGIWQRWSSYADKNNLTGGNKTFEDMKEYDPNKIIDNFTYSIIEIFDFKTPREYIIKREEYWKKVFRSVEKGMNNNASKT